MNTPKHRLNELTILFTAFLYLIPLLISGSWEMNLIILGISIINLRAVRKINTKYLGYLILIMLLPLLSLFITVLLYSKPVENDFIINTIIGFSIKNSAYNNAIYLTTRALSISMISFIYLLSIHYDALVFSFMQVTKLPVAIGYSLMATFNAFFYMKDEFFRIQSAWRMRFGKKKFPLTLIFPILVSASRYAYHAGLSLECRGLNNEKTYVEHHPWKIRDTLYLIINCCEIAAVYIILAHSTIINFRLK